MPYTVALFDLGGVLIELTGVPRMLEWTGSTMTEKELWTRWLASPCIRRFESGRASVEEFAREICSEFSLPVATDLFLSEFTLWPKAPFPGAIELLRELAPRMTIASLSNTNVLHWERIRDEMALAGLFHYNFPSHLTGFLKPDREAFEHVVDALGVPPAEIIFFDDNLVNVEQARSIGIDAHHVFGPDEGPLSALLSRTEKKYRSCSMSTFGYETFENDEAIDWLEQLVEGGNIDLLTSTLSDATGNGDTLLPQTKSERSLAAAEVVAVWHGHAGDGTPLEVLDWVAHQETPLPSHLLELARRAVERVRGGSELHASWQRTGEIAEWRIAIDDLYERLHR